jgi:hypothetical protein
MRSPIKKINVSDPLGRYAGIENGTHSRLVEASNKIDKMLPKNTLPFVASNKVYVDSLKGTRELQMKNSGKENIQEFLNKNRGQINVINKSYEYRAKMPLETVPCTIVPADESIKKFDEIHEERKKKKYSERHKDRILGNVTNKELGRLIDPSELYSDDIFNKYLEINTGPGYRKESLKGTAKSRVDFHQ